MPKANLDGLQAVSPDDMKKLDLIICIDRSGSMSQAGRKPGTSKWDEMREEVESKARAAAKYDDDGITVIDFAGDNANVHDGVTAEAVEQLFQKKGPGGGTPLHLAIAAAVKKAQASNKEAVIGVYTDGTPDDETLAIKAMTDAGTKLGRPKIGFYFSQVGNDAGAAKFLSKLDNDMSVDVVATFTEAQTEECSLEQLAWAARNW